MPTPDSLGPWRVRVEHSSAQGVSASAATMSDGSGSTRQTAAQGSGQHHRDFPCDAATVRVVEGGHRVRCGGLCTSWHGRPGGVQSAASVKTSVMLPVSAPVKRTVEGVAKELF